MTQKIYLKTVLKDTAENWSNHKGVLPVGVIAYENDTNKMKISDGVKELADLPYVSGETSSVSSDALLERVRLLEDKVMELGLASKESATVEGGKVVVPAGATDVKVVNATMTKASDLKADTIAVKGLTVTSTASSLSKLTLTGSDLTVSDSTFSGEFSKLGSNDKATGTNVIQVQVPEEETTLVIKNVTINTPLSYNGLLTNNANIKSVLIDNVKMLGRFDNNAITISGTADNAVVTISNCEFDTISNLLRISNISNSKGVVINLINCSIKQWEQDNPQWRGMICCQDYTSKTVEAEAEMNLFAPEKITIHITNCSLNGKKLTEADREDLIYVYRTAEAKADGTKGTYRYSNGQGIMPTLTIN